MSNISNDALDRLLCMMGNSQSEVARYSKMYQDWGLSIPTTRAKISTLSQMTALSRIVVSIDTGA
jgi:hypothetical protein